MDFETAIILDMILSSEIPYEDKNSVRFEVDEQYNHPQYMKIWIISLNEVSEEKQSVFIEQFH